MLYKIVIQLRKLMCQIAGLPLHIVSLLMPKKNNLVLFGAWGGSRYGDNAAFVFEYMAENHKEVKCVWITKNKSICDESTNENIWYYLSLRSLWAHLRARCFVYSSGFDDFMAAAITSRSVTINLWHGSPIKQIGYDDRIHQPSGLVAVIRDLRNRILPFSSNRPDYVLSSGPAFDEIMMSAFRPKVGLLRIGQPRNDALLESSETPNIILYAPTFRDDGSLPNYTEQLDLDKLSNVCESRNWLFLMRLHPAEKGRVKLKQKFKNIYLDNGQFGDLYKDILPRTHALITDYSSLIFDFNLTGRSIFLYPFDYESYVVNSRNFYWDYCSQFRDLIMKSWDDIIDALSEPPRQRKGCLWDTYGRLGRNTSETANFIVKNILSREGSERRTPFLGHEVDKE